MYVYCVLQRSLDDDMYDKYFSVPKIFHEKVNAIKYVHDLVDEINKNYLPGDRSMVQMMVDIDEETKDYENISAQDLSDQKLFVAGSDDGTSIWFYKDQIF